MQNLKDWRVAKGLTQGELAEKLGSNQKSYSAYETGRTATPGEIQAKLKKMGYQGAFPHEAKAEAAEGVTRGEYEAIRQELWKTLGRVERLETAFEKLTEAVRLLLKEREANRPPEHG